jgi:hypothetical protein
MWRVCRCKNGRIKVAAGLRQGLPIYKKSTEDRRVTARNAVDLPLQKKHGKK